MTGRRCFNRRVIFMLQKLNYMLHNTTYIITYNFEGHSDAYVQYLPTDLGLNKSPFPFNLIKLIMDFVRVVIKITPKNVITKF